MTPPHTPLGGSRPVAITGPHDREQALDALEQMRGCLAKLDGFRGTGVAAAHLSQAIDWLEQALDDMPKAG